MPRNGDATRVAIMDAAERLILDRGYAGTPIDDVLAETGVTKGAFFHHFASKRELAHALIARYVEADVAHLEGKLACAEATARDPLRQLLRFVELFIAEAEALTAPYPGCLLGSYCYQTGLFDDDINAMIGATFRRWRERLTHKLEQVAAIHPPRRSVDLASLADQITVTFEGAYIVSRMLAEPGVVASQLRHHRTYLELLFEDDGDAR